MKRALKYIITLAIGFVFVLAIILGRDIFSLTDRVTILHILTDAFTAVGVVMTGVGLLIFCSNEGVFDGLTYAVKSFVNLFRKNAKHYNSLYDYRESKGREKLSFGFMVLCGLFFYVTSLILYFVWRKYAS